MARDTDIHVGDIGTILQVTILDNEEIVNVQTSGSCVHEIWLRKPDGTSIVRTAEFYTDGTDGIIEYVADDDIFDQAGIWAITARIILDSGTWTASANSFVVKSAFQ